MGTPLFHRKHGMLLTPAGELLLPYAEQVLRLLDEAPYVLQNAGEPKGRLSIGTYQSVSTIDLSQIFARYHRDFPCVELSLQILPSTELVDQILHFKLDGAFIVTSAYDKEALEEEWATNVQLVIIAPPTAKRLEDAFALPFLMQAQGCNILAEYANGKSSLCYASQFG